MGRKLLQPHSPKEGKVKTQILQPDDIIILVVFLFSELHAWSQTVDERCLMLVNDDDEFIYLYIWLIIFFF